MPRWCAFEGKSYLGKEADEREEQALAVLEALQAVRQAVWSIYGRQAQQAWRDQLVPDHGPPALISAGVSTRKAALVRQ